MHYTCQMIDVEFFLHGGVVYRLKGGQAADDSFPGETGVGNWGQVRLVDFLKEHF
jgi:hypothetical protein